MKVSSLSAPTWLGAPLMLVMEDVHWADSGSLVVGRYLACRSRLNKLPVLIVMTYRDVELDAACCLDDILYDYSISAHRGV